MNYKVICDKGAMLDFIGGLPECQKDEQYYLCLFGRKKYCRNIKNINSDKSQLVRKTATKDRLFQKISQLECPLGTYFNANTSIPQEALALYINPNPRSLTKATYCALKEYANVISSTAGTFDGFNPQAEAMSSIQKSPSRKIWGDFDIDTKEDGILEKVEEILKDKSCYRVLETRGGYHVLVEYKKLPKNVDKLWHNKLSQLADIKGDCMIPVPGSYQGNFVPRFID